MASYFIYLSTDEKSYVFVCLLFESEGNLIIFLLVFVFFGFFFFFFKKSLCVRVCVLKVKGTY